MLFPAKNQTVKTTVSAEPQNDFTLKTLVGEATALAQDENLMPFLARRDPLGTSLRPVAQALQRKAHAMLETVVNIWVEQTRPLLGIAEMFRDMKELQQRTQSMAAASEEMTASIGELARSAETVADDAKNVKQELFASVGHVNEALSSMDGIAGAFSALTDKVQTLDKASEQIADILKAIEKIAAQTNLLALNATIEAARAGEMGKGFAVVAGEVKTLAKQTSGATEDIRKRITALKAGMSDMLTSMNDGAQKVADGTKVIHAVSDNIHLVGARVDEVTQKMVGVSATVQEQSTAVGEVTGNITAIAKMSEDVIAKVDGVTEGLNRASEYVKKGLDESTKNLDAEMLILATKADHASFKKRIVDTMLGKGQEQSAALPDHHKCRLGKWYDGLTDEAIKRLPTYARLAEPHARVHATGKRVLELTEHGDFAGAFAEAQRLDTASNEVIACLDDLHNAVLKQMKE